MYRNVLRNRDFNLYFASRALSGAGNGISGIAFLLLVYNATHSAVQATGVALAETVPYALFGLIGGASADRLPKKPALIAFDAARGAVMLAVAALFFAHELTYPFILAVLFLVETAGCFYHPVSRAVLPNLVRSEDRAHANSLVAFSQSGARLIGPAAVYFFLQKTGYGAFFLADGAAYLLSSGMLSFLRIPRQAIAPRRGPGPAGAIAEVFRSFAEFARFSWRTPDLRNLFAATTWVVFFNTWVWQIGLLLKMESLFRNGQPMYSLCLLGFSASSIAAGLLLPLRYRTLRLTHYMAGAGLWGVGLIGVGVSHNAGTIAMFSALVGIGVSTSSLSRVFLLQDKVPEAIRGRAFSLSAVLLYAANTVSLSSFGAVSRRIRVPVLFALCGMGIVLAVFAHAALAKASPLRRGRSV